MKYILIFVLGIGCGESATVLETENSVETTESNTPIIEHVQQGDKKYQEFYPNGNVKIEGNKKDGIRHGLWTSYNEAGKVKSRGEYINGMQQGPSVVYHNNGAVYYSGSYMDGQQVGEWRFYDETGELSKTVDFDAAKKSDK